MTPSPTSPARAVARLDQAARLILRDPELARDAVQEALDPSLARPAGASRSRPVRRLAPSTDRQRLPRPGPASHAPCRSKSSSLRSTHPSIADVSGGVRRSRPGRWRAPTPRRAAGARSSSCITSSACHCRTWRRRSGIPLGTVKSRLHRALGEMRIAIVADRRRPDRGPCREGSSHDAERHFERDLPAHPGRHRDRAPTRLHRRRPRRPRRSASATRLDIPRKVAPRGTRDERVPTTRVAMAPARLSSRCSRLILAAMRRRLCRLATAPARAIRAGGERVDRVRRRGRHLRDGSSDGADGGHRSRGPRSNASRSSRGMGRASRSTARVRVATPCCSCDADGTNMTARVTTRARSMNSARTTMLSFSPDAALDPGDSLVGQHLPLLIPTDGGGQRTDRRRRWASTKPSFRPPDGSEILFAGGIERATGCQASMPSTSRRRRSNDRRADARSRIGTMVVARWSAHRYSAAWIDGRQGRTGAHM